MLSVETEDRSSVPFSRTMRRGDQDQTGSEEDVGSSLTDALNLVRVSSRHRLPPVSCREETRKFINHAWYNVLMSAATVFVLFGDDVRLAVFPPAADIYFTVFASIFFFLFILEIILQAVAKTGYLPKPQCPERGCRDWRRLYRIFLIGSFYFWLDVVATASIIPEVSACVLAQ